MRLISSVIFCALFFVSSVVFACMHGPHVEQTKFHVALALVNGKQTIVIKPEIRTKGSKMGWVFLVPKVPTMMAVGKSDVLDVMNKHFFPRQITKGGRSKSKVALKVGKRTRVGPFSITPIEGGYEGISKWLKKHDFGHIEEGHIKPYLDKGWVVLAAKIKVKKSKARTNGQIKKNEG